MSGTAGGTTGGGTLSSPGAETTQTGGTVAGATAATTSASTADDPTPGDSQDNNNPDNQPQPTATQAGKSGGGGAGQGGANPPSAGTHQGQAPPAVKASTSGINLGPLSGLLGGAGKLGSSTTLLTVPNASTGVVANGPAAGSKVPALLTSGSLNLGGFNLNTQTILIIGAALVLILVLSRPAAAPVQGG